MSATRNSLLLSVGALALCTMGAHAQEQVEDAEARQQTVIVTGVAKQTTIFDSSASVSSLPDKAIQSLAPRSINELFRALPGVNPRIQAVMPMRTSRFVVCLLRPGDRATCRCRKMDFQPF